MKFKNKTFLKKFLSLFGYGKDIDSNNIQKSELNKLNKGIEKFDAFRLQYDQMSFKELVAMRDQILYEFPEQAHYTISIIHYWIKNLPQKDLFVAEIGGWRGDLAKEMLETYPQIKMWHNFDVISDAGTQKCQHNNYQLISLPDYIWNLEISKKYNLLIATHMIEHIKWRELEKLIKWIPVHIESVLFEAPIAKSAENFNWMGELSSHILEKGWDQVISEMAGNGFKKIYHEKDTVIFNRI